ncbi:MAG TPA: TetR/AcrR family transcriptional regulator [Verrucomicrobiae bacterium]
MRPKAKPAGITAVRDPDRTRRRILDAALSEFSTRGFAGARVGGIARCAQVNKRMIYHYFDDKEGLFRAVLRHKISDRLSRVVAQAPESDMASSLPLWFRQNCQDADWVRLLAWESLQTTGDSVLDEKERRRLARSAVARIKQKQAEGELRQDVSAVCLQLAKTSLTMFPLALPQIARLIIGHSPRDPKFQREYAQFLETISTVFRPEQRRTKINTVQTK